MKEGKGRAGAVAFGNFDGIGCAEPKHGGWNLTIQAEEPEVFAPHDRIDFHDVLTAESVGKDFDEAFGERLVHRRDSYAGTSLRGLGGFDVTLQGTLLASDTTREERLEGQGIARALDGSQQIRQARPTLVVLYRIVDDEAIPDVPKTPLAGLNLVVPVRADFAYRGPDAFDNVRAGAELWSKLIVTDLRGTSFLLTAGYEAQWFHRVGQVVHLGRVEMRMGWGAL